MRNVLNSKINIKRIEKVYNKNYWTFDKSQEVVVYEDIPARIVLQEDIISSIMGQMRDGWIIECYVEYKVSEAKIWDIVEHRSNRYSIQKIFQPSWKKYIKFKLVELKENE